MMDALPWFIFGALFICAALLRTPKSAPLLRFSQLWLGLAMSLLALLDMRGGHPAWLKWVVLGIVAVLASLSITRNEGGQRTRFATMWAVVRAWITGARRDRSNKA